MHNTCVNATPCVYGLKVSFIFALSEPTDLPGEPGIIKLSAMISVTYFLFPSLSS